jgi:hypothetical protein
MACDFISGKGIGTFTGMDGGEQSIKFLLIKLRMAQ